MNNHCFTEEIKLADEEGQELRTLLEGSYGLITCSVITIIIYLYRIEH